MGKFNVDYIKRRLSGKFEYVDVTLASPKSFCAYFRASPRQYYRSAIYAECDDRCEVTSDLVARLGISPVLKEIPRCLTTLFFKKENRSYVSCKTDINDYHNFEELVSTMDKNVKIILEKVIGRG